MVLGVAASDILYMLSKWPQWLGSGLLVLSLNSQNISVREAL